MANILFKLRQEKGSEPQPIYLVYWFGSKDRIFYSTGFKVNPQYWNAKKHRVRDVVECTTKDIINNRLSELEKVTEKYIATQMASGEAITKETLRAFLDNYTNPKETKGNTLTDFVKEFVENGTKKINPSTGEYITLRTVQAYKKFQDYLSEFEEKQRRKYDFTDIDLDFYEDFTAYLRSTGLATNTIGKYIRILKAVLNEATEKGINKTTAYKSHRFKVVEEESENIYLDEDELELLHSLDLSQNTRLERVRDLFLVGAWTGLRFSDFIRIKQENIKGNYIEIEQQKTRKRVLIPLHPVVLEIWEKYDKKLPPNITNQKLNDYIKEVCELAGLNKHEHKAITKGGVKRSQRFEKWELVSSHTARRSFATNLFLDGFPTLSIMQVTGHKTEKAFMKYIKVTPEQHAKLLHLHWEKKGKQIKVAK